MTKESATRNYLNHIVTQMKNGNTLSDSEAVRPIMLLLILDKISVDDVANAVNSIDEPYRKQFSKQIIQDLETIIASF